MVRLLAVLVLAGASVNAQTLHDNLRAHYTFSGNANDQSGNNRNATTSNTAYVADRFGNAQSAIQFNGLNSYVFADNYVFSPNVSSEVTISFWYKQYSNESRPVNANPEGHYILWETLNSPGDNYMPQAMATLADRIKWGGVGGSEAYSSYDVYAPNTWNHVIFTGNSSNQLATFYVYKSDGTLLTNTTNSFNWGSHFSGNIIFGADRLLRSPYGGHDDYFFGEMDDIRIYDRTLSDTEVASLHAAEKIFLSLPFSNALTNQTEVDSYFIHYPLPGGEAQFAVNNQRLEFTTTNLGTVAKPLRLALPASNNWSASLDVFLNVTKGTNGTLPDGNFYWVGFSLGKGANGETSYANRLNLKLFQDHTGRFVGGNLFRSNQSVVLAHLTNPASASNKIVLHYVAKTKTAYCFGDGHFIQSFKLGNSTNGWDLAEGDSMTLSLIGASEPYNSNAEPLNVAPGDAHLKNLEVKPSAFSIEGIYATPQEFFLHTPEQLLSSRAAGRADVTNNPNQYNLFTSAQTNQSYTAGQQSVLTDPNSYNLFHTNQILDMKFGGMVLARTNNEWILSYQINQSTNLTNWTSYREESLVISNAPADKMFLRLNPKQ